jgi:hypothetical protein
MNHQVPETARLEIKFVAYETNLQSLLRWLRLHHAGFSSPYPSRQVNNVYFDTHNYAAYVENLSGASSRTKVRYRWYGESRGPDSGTLEIKCKRNYFGWKLRYPILEAPYIPRAYWRTVRRSLLEQLPADGKKWFDANPFPVLLNRYHRQYFLSSDGKVRTTVDTKQAVWDQRFKPYPNFKHAANHPHVLVVEFKFDRKDRDLASQILQGIPIRVSRHSKYMTGMQAISRF